MPQFHKTPLIAVVLDLSTLGNIKSQMHPLPPKSREKKEEYKCQLSALKTPVLSMLQTRLKISCSCLSLFCHWRLLINV